MSFIDKSHSEHAVNELIASVIDTYERAILPRITESARWTYIRGLVGDRQQQICAEIAMHRLEARSLVTHE